MLISWLKRGLEGQRLPTFGANSVFPVLLEIKMRLECIGICYGLLQKVVKSFLAHKHLLGFLNIGMITWPSCSIKTILGCSILRSPKHSSKKYKCSHSHSVLCMEEVVAVDANVRWIMPRKDKVKINVHGCFFEVPLPNGNRTGIGLVVRNSKGKILRMIAGSLEFINRRLNEYQALLEGCKCAYLELWEDFILECDHLDSFWEWKNSTLEGVHPDHAHLVQQLNQRQADRNFRMEVTLCDANANALATYLAHHGAENFKNMVIIEQPFGRVRELWNLDMGLGSADPRFVAIHERDLNPDVVDVEAVPEVDNGPLVAAVQGEDDAEMVELIVIDDD